MGGLAGRVWARTHACALAYPLWYAQANWWRTEDALSQGPIVSASCCDTGADCYKLQIAGKSFDPKTRRDRGVA